MNTLLAIVLVILFIVANILFLRWFFSRRQASPALDTFAAANGWQVEDLARKRGTGPSTCLTDSDWSLTITYRNKSQTSAHLIWSAPAPNVDTFAVAPPLPPQMIEMIERTPAHTVDNVADHVIRKMFPQTADILTGLTFQKDTLTNGRGVLMTSTDTAGQDVYRSSALMALQSDLPRTAGLTILHAMDQLKLTIEIDTDNPAYLKALVAGGIALQQIA